MKKIFAFLLTTMLLFSCSNDDHTPNGMENEGKLSFELRAVTGMETRAGTPIYSQEATQKVTRVNIHAFKDDGSGNFLYEKSYNVPGWTEGTTSKVYDVAEAEKLDAGTYKFLAVGQDATDNYTLTTPEATTTIENMIASISTLGDEYEIFADVKQAEVTSVGTRVSLNMTRKVAGVMGYFKNIPQVIDTKTVTYLRLNVSSTNMGVNLSTGLGSSPSTAYNLIDIDLTGQSVANGYYTGNDLSGAGIVKLSNSQLMGKYLIPVTDITMTLGLYDALGDPIKEWTILNAGSTSFDILANNFYSLGTKLEAGNTTGGGTTPDTPIDLSVDTEITITITPDWDFFHYLTLQ